MVSRFAGVVLLETKGVRRKGLVMSLKATVLLILILTSIPAQSQDRTTVREKNELAVAELQEIMAESAKLDEKLAMVHVRARAAALMSYYDAVRSETMFRTLWRFANQQLERDSDKEQAKLLILKYVSSRNPKLAREFLAAQSVNSSKAGDTARDSSHLNTKLAANLIDGDPSMAAALLERSLNSTPSPAGMGTLARLSSGGAPQQCFRNEKARTRRAFFIQELRWS